MCSYGNGNSRCCSGNRIRPDHQCYCFFPDHSGHCEFHGMDRARKALHYGALVSFVIGVGMFFLSFFHEDLLAGIFSSDASVITAAADYLKAYAIDCMLTAIFFCYTGFYNGIGKTKFVMIQGIIGAFGVRVPISYFMSIQPEPSLFHIGLATPMSSALQLILCLGFMYCLKKTEFQK